MMVMKVTMTMNRLPCSCMSRCTCFLLECFIGLLSLCSYEAHKLFEVSWLLHFLFVCLFLCLCIHVKLVSYVCPYTNCHAASAFAIGGTVVIMTTECGAAGGVRVWMVNICREWLDLLDVYLCKMANNDLKTCWSQIHKYLLFFVC